MRWLRASAEQGHAPAMYYLALSGVEDSASWLRLAAGQGYPLAQHALGVL